MPEEALNEIAERLRAESRQRGLIMTDEQGTPAPIPVALTPWVFSPEVARYLRTFFRGTRRTVNRILGHYFEDPKLQEILPLREHELKWLKASCPEGMPRLQTVFERFDTNLGPHPESQLSDFKVIEFNGVGVGCIYLMPAATDLLRDLLVPRLKEAIPDLALASPSDYRQLLLGDLQQHARAIDRAGGRIGLVERRETVAGGTDEFSFIASYFGSKGVVTVMGDPREIEHRSGGLHLREEPVDVLYRDFQLEEVVSIKTHGGDVDGIEEAFAQNQVVSTVFGEFDHKSLCELLSNPEFSTYFTAEEVRSARRHIPWTRLISERMTADPDGRVTELTPYIRQNRETLVLKPNRGYGGEGVVVGARVTGSAWEEALGKAMVKPGAWVVQEQVPILKEPVMLLGQRGTPKLEEMYVTLGVTATPRGVSFVGRCSGQSVVNITQGGGLVPVFLAGKP